MTSFQDNSFQILFLKYPRPGWFQASPDLVCGIFPLSIRESSRKIINEAGASDWRFPRLQTKWKPGLVRVKQRQVVPLATTDFPATGFLPRPQNI